MISELEHGHPFSGVDLAQLDDNFASLLAQAAESDRRHESRSTGKPGLTIREKRLFRFGMLVGQAEWDLASEAIGSLADEGLLTVIEVERAVAESVFVKGWPVSFHLGMGLTARGIHIPASVAQAIPVVQASRRITELSETAGDNIGLTEREIFALGLGITWGARCWDT